MFEAIDDVQYKEFITAIDRYTHACQTRDSVPDKPCTPLYNITDAGGPRVIPALLFTGYWKKRDTQRLLRWTELIPQPTAGLSLSSPTDDFFLGGSSEFVRNVQFDYGLHLGRVKKLGANSTTQFPTDSSGPPTTMTLQKGVFLGLSFNLDFLKGILPK